MKNLVIALLLMAPALASAEDDGNELLGFMQNPGSRDVAMMYVEAARKEWDGTLFCVTGGDPQKLAFDAVRQYLESHPEQRYRPRRYLIIQGLRTGYPCKP
ncbi:MAG TPA: Rap1a/Tai family immunity protein [Burkholderiales bacterium]